MARLIQTMAKIAKALDVSIEDLIKKKKVYGKNFD